MAVRRKASRFGHRDKLAIEHTAWYPYLLRFLEAQRLLNRSEASLQRRDSDLRRFVVWCEERGLDEPTLITKPVLESYRRTLFYYRRANGQPLSPSSQNYYLSSVRQWFKWLTRENYLLYNPASELELPKITPSLPIVLSIEEINTLLSQPDTRTDNGVRTRAMLELLYSTGLRRTELCRLDVSDLSFSRLTVFVRQGKGGKDRLLPVGERALQWCLRYLNTVRDRLLMDEREPALFLNDSGERYQPSNLGERVKHLMQQAGINAPGSCHLLRHAMATHMLENGADIRYIQHMLGHTDLSTTQIYTQVSIESLRAVHRKTHPATANNDAAENEG